ncbi:hypothetical protein GH714_027146 [Hevea brasiliensis]|uniref:Peroxidase n=1 Tax=Hevea brasiliensis TaxID=3981 RepID=A0A6A6NKJ7_HEVBR|nr:hypothetical protein GH714_027146 [Hevea brasiliensis]
MAASSPPPRISHVPSIFIFPIQTLPDYYSKTCPQFQETMGHVVSENLLLPTLPAAVLRLFFHDCAVEGCDGSILISSTSFNKAERDAEPNLLLPGDAFDVVVRAKTALELQCPGIVSCSDILATAVRDLVSMVGGPKYSVPLGRKDGLESNAARVEGNLPSPTMPLSKIIFLYASKGFSVQEMVALAGARTIGFSQCKEFSNRLFNFSKSSDSDPAYSHKYAEALKKLCANYTQDPSMSAYNDELAVDERTKPFVDLYASNSTAFFQDFALAMEKLSVYKVKTDREGENFEYAFQGDYAYALNL